MMMVDGVVVHHVDTNDSTVWVVVQVDLVINLMVVVGMVLVVDPHHLLVVDLCHLTIAHLLPMV